MATAEARIQLSERSGICRRLHPRLPGLRKVSAVIVITRSGAAETKIAAPAQLASPKRLRCDRRLRFRDNANHRTGASLSRSTPRIKFGRVPSLVRECRYRARF